jgi:hypothetical protein
LPDLVVATSPAAAATATALRARPWFFIDPKEFIPF